jgi:hypothetical protein
VSTTLETANSLNYFNYFTELEEAFIRRRGKHLWLSPVDWAMMESWKERGVPLHIAIRGIERSFDSYESKPRHRTVKSLLYCREEVEAQYAEWLEGQVGTSEGAKEMSPEGISEQDAGLPFPREAIREHLRRAQAALLERLNTFTDPLDAELLECFMRSGARLKELEEDLTGTAHPSAQKLDQSLTHIERMLDEAVRAHASSERVASAKEYAAAQLSEYRKRMDKETYEQTLESLFVKRLREDYGLPRLSLFYL